MTEAEWLACEDPAAMLAVLRAPQIVHRKKWAHISDEPEGGAA